MKCMRDLKTAIMIILAVILLSMMMKRVGYHGFMMTHGYMCGQPHKGMMGGKPHKGMMGEEAHGTGYMNGECPGYGC